VPSSFENDILICDIQPFVNEILSAGNAKLASTFVPKCTALALEERVELWLKCGMPAKAGEEALRAKNVGLLEEIKGKASGGDVMEIQRMISQLQRR